MPSAPEPLVLAAEQIEASVGERLDVFLAAQLGRSRNHAQELLRQGVVDLAPHPRLARPNYRLRSGDSLSVRLPGPAKESAGAPLGEDLPLEVIFEDEALIAINKQPGLVVHPAAGNRTGTLVNALVHRWGAALAQRGGGERLGLVHRLDKDTSGLIIIAKTDLAHERLAAAFAERKVRKLYRALCWGHFRRASGDLRSLIGRHPVQRQKMAVLKRGGREAHTGYRVLAQSAMGAEVECELHTGRTHQIRVHLANLGHPVWGDLTYGRAHLLQDGHAPARQMLHAARLDIAHPLSGKDLRLEAAPPQDYLESRSRFLGES